MDGTRFLPGNAEQDSTGSLCLELRAGGAQNADMGVGVGGGGVGEGVSPRTRKAITKLPQ